MKNMDFNKRVVTDSNAEQWVASPKPGVWRRPLSSENAERGHATSVVRYEPGATSSSHGHPLGEEILVLSGTFSGETGDYGVGTYFRNLEEFSHAPFSEEGCEIFVKLHQFSPGDDTHVCIDAQNVAWQPGLGNLKVMPLHQFESEYVALVR